MQSPWLKAKLVVGLSSMIPATEVKIYRKPGKSIVVDLPATNIFFINYPDVQ